MAPPKHPANRCPLSQTGLLEESPRRTSLHAHAVNLPSSVKSLAGSRVTDYWLPPSALALAPTNFPGSLSKLTLQLAEQK